MTKGLYKVIIRKTADSLFFALMTYNGDQCVPGIPGKHYATKVAAQRGAKSMLAKV